jgi:hypothetical protein
MTENQSQQLSSQSTIFPSKEKAEQVSLSGFLDWLTGDR